LVEQRT